MTEDFNAQAWIARALAAGLSPCALLDEDGNRWISCTLPPAAERQEEQALADELHAAPGRHEALCEALLAAGRVQRVILRPSVPDRYCSA